MAVGVGQHHGHGADALGLRQQGGQGRPTFQGVGVEEVEEAGGVVAEAVGLEPRAPEVVV